MRDIQTEGDKYYRRNKKAQDGFVSDMFHDHLGTLVSKGTKVLEVGCMNGYRLHDLAAKKGAVCYGIDPSREAIQEGTASYPDIHLDEGMSHQLPYPDNEFDVVYMNFVLYCVPREFVLRTVSEMDRVLKDGGRLVIADFFPDTPHRRPDRHAEGEFSYKNRFWEMFTSSIIYKETARIRYTFGKEMVEDSSITGGDNDCIIVDMQKSLQDFYPVRNL